MVTKKDVCETLKSLGVNNGDILLGNIFEESFEDILNKPKTANIKKSFEKGIITCKLCKTCGFLKRLENKRK